GRPDPLGGPLPAPGVPQLGLDDLQGPPRLAARPAAGAHGRAAPRRLHALRAEAGLLPGPRPPQHLLLPHRRRRLPRILARRLHHGSRRRPGLRRRRHRLLAGEDLRARPPLPQRLVIRRLFPRGPADFLWQAAIVVGGYTLWRYARGAAD